VEQRLEGGNAGGAVLVDGTVRRPTGPWTSSVHALLRHLEHHGFEGSPRARGVDHHGREILSFVPGATIGTKRPWPSWVHSDDALQQVGGWLRGYHDCVSDFVPPVGATWRAGSHAWRPGDVIGHNDAAPYNAVWQTLPDGRTDLVGFIDWDFASPCAPIRDLAFVASAWVPLHNREAARSEGFHDCAARPRRLRMLLDAYGWTGTAAEVLDAVRARIVDHIRIVRELADGDPVFQRQVDAGAQADRQLTDIHETLRQFDRDRSGLDSDQAG
jgi:hypothetical protein